MAIVISAGALLVVTPNVTKLGISASAQSAFVDEVPSQTFVVTTTSDGTGAGTLRTAITSANANPGLDTITFNISGSGQQNLPITSALPVITDPVVIDGTTQPGYAGVPLIRLTPGASGIASLINITGGGSTVKALSFASFSGITTNNGVIVLASNNNTVAACHSGTGSGNTQVYITGANNLVGGSTAADRNFFYGNTSSRENIIIRGNSASGNRVTGNVFGTTPAGVRQTNSGKNILIEDAPNNVIGGNAGSGFEAPGAPCSGECNLLSGTDNDAVAIFGTGATGNLVTGNFIGMLADGLNVNRNANYGVHIQNAANNTVGPNNLISANTFGQVFVEGTGGSNVIIGNYIGLKVNGTEAVTGTFNVPAFGIQLNSNGNRVGGVTAGERNIVSGSNRGIIINGASNLVQGNFIGTDVTGSFALTTQLDGVLINGANNTIGGTAGTTPRGACTGACNLISGNGRNGVNNGLVINGANATGNVVDGNMIGLSAAGSASLLNGDPQFGGRAILITGAGGNLIGRLPAGNAGNIVDVLNMPEVGETCIQDDVTGSYVVLSAASPKTVIDSRDCRTGGGAQSEQVTERSFFENGITGHRFIGKFVGVTVEDITGRGSAGFNSGPGGPHTVIKDSNINDNPLPCRCPQSAEQAVNGQIELAAQAANSPNTVARNLLNKVWLDGLMNSSNIPQKPIWESDEGLAYFLANHVDAYGNPAFTMPSIDRLRRNTMRTTLDNKFISNGNVPALQFLVTVLPTGEANISGTLSGTANTTYRIELSRIKYFGTTPTSIIQSDPIGVEFDTATNGNGTAAINQTFGGADGALIRESGYIAAIVTVYTSQGVPGGSSEMSTPIATPGVSIAGRVITPGGTGLRNATVTITDADTGARNTATTSTFGYFSFDDMRTDRSYTLGVSSRRYRFAPQQIYAFDAITDISFVGQE